MHRCNNWQPASMHALFQIFFNKTCTVLHFSTVHCALHKETCTLRCWLFQIYFNYAALYNMFHIIFNKTCSVVNFKSLSEDLHSALFQISFAKRLISFFSSAKLALYSFNKSRREHASAPSCVAPMQAANWVAVKTTGTLKPPVQICTLDHFALLHKCKRSETLAPFYLFILCWTLTMTTRLLQNVVKLLQSKIAAKLLQEGAYWRGASTLCTKVGVHCTQLHTVAHWHEIAQKHETKVHNAPGAPLSIQPPPCLQRKSGIRKENLRARLFPQNF